MFDKLRPHHLGFIVPLEEKAEIERKYGKNFVYDEIQKTHVLFAFKEDLDIYIEFICREGRVANQKCGFAHVCYNVKDKIELERVQTYIADNKLGYAVTKLEKSGSQECGRIIFYYIKNIGVVELNLA
jgi:hypothetical protein